jgi:hypothetical protein
MANKMTLKPPKPTAEEFIKAANKEVETFYPWEDSRVREDVIKSVNLRLNEPVLLKLQYVSEKTRKSQQELIREALVPYLDQIIQEL